MNDALKRDFFTFTLSAAALLTPGICQAARHSPTSDIQVVRPAELPEAARAQGSSLFLYSNDSGQTMLYIEQQQGARLVAFDVTDPSAVKFLSSTPLEAATVYDPVVPLGSRGELVRFRDGRGLAVLDLSKPRRPVLHTAPSLQDAVEIAPLGHDGLLLISSTRPLVTRPEQDYQVLDTSKPSQPVLLASVVQVSYEATNGETGTTFLLGADGVTMVRRLSTEREFKTRQAQMSGN